MDVSTPRWNASISTKIPIRPSALGHAIYGTGLLLLQQVPTVGFKAVQNVSLSLHLKCIYQMKTDTSAPNIRERQIILHVKRMQWK